MKSYAEQLKLDGSRFLILGAGDGMGGSTARALAEFGATVACADIREEAVNVLRDEIGAHPLVGDITKRNEIERLVQEAEEGIGPLDGFVDIVGSGAPTTVLGMSEDLLDQQLTINFRHAVNATQVVADRIISRGGTGRFLFISSVMGGRSAPGLVGYGAAKAALESFIRTASLELGPKGIRLNAIAPGFMVTPNVIRGDKFANEIFDRLVPETPVGRLGSADDVAGAALFLMSDLAGFITGHTLTVDGGVDAKFGYKF